MGKYEYVMEYKEKLERMARKNGTELNKCRSGWSSNRICIIKM
jgi:hypothetical protein